MVSTRAARFTLAGLAGLIFVGLGAALDAELWHTSAVPPSAPSEGPASLVAQADGAAAPVYGIKLPPGYRDWKMISVAHVGGSLNDLRVKLGNDAAIKAYRQGTLPFPDGTIIVRLAYRGVTSEENNELLRQSLERVGLSPEQRTKLLAESFVAGPATNVQFMVKDSKRYASTGGWGFAQFDGKPADEAVHRTCFSCHEPAKERDFVFTRYAP